MISASQSPSSFCVFGAGSVGCYLGARLQSAGAQVTFVGRPRIGERIDRHGLRYSDYRGSSGALPASAVRFHLEPAVVGDADVVLVTVKSAATMAAAATLAPLLKPGAVVVSFQNGLRNATLLREALSRAAVLAGMVPFNVLACDDGRFHQGSSGDLMLEADAAVGAGVEALFARAGLPLRRRTDMPAVQWAKLLLNLNNAVNALAGVPLREELSQRGYRRCLAAAQREALGLLRQRGIALPKLTGVPARWFPTLLELPDAVFRRAARAALAIDPLARSSMWEDLEAGRATEVNWINGEVVMLARDLGCTAPVNAMFTSLVHDAERGGRRDWRADALWHVVRSAMEASRG